MVPADRLKEVLLQNERFILEEVKGILPREDAAFPEGARKVCILYGVRRGGKTHLLFDRFKRRPDRSLYLDFEDDRLEGFEVQDFERVLETFYEWKPQLVNQKGIVFLLDEVQNVVGWERFARRVAEKEGIQVFATGSSSKLMPQQVHTALRGRSWSQEIFPFSFREYARARGWDLKDPELLYGNKKAWLKNALQDYLKWGGFPEVCFLKSEYEKRKVLKEYLEAMFFRDLVERFQIKNIPLLERLQDKLFSSYSLKYSLNSFWRQYKDQLPFSKDSAFSYYRHFLESLLVWEVRKLSESSYQRLRNPAKIYLIDPGVARRVTSADWGRMLENVVFLELRRSGWEVFYFEGKGECDFVAKDGKGWAAYQVAWRLEEQNRAREIQGLVEACQALKLKRGTLLTYDQEAQEKVNHIAIQIKPVWRWMAERGEELPGHPRES